MVGALMFCLATALLLPARAFLAPLKLDDCQCRRWSGRRTATVLLSFSSKQTSPQDLASEEILLKIRFSVQPDATAEEAQKELSRFSQSFPFAAVLPVQPLYYMPTDDGGVEVTFLRKKTEEKSGVDGGIRFFLETPTSTELEVTVKRKSEGQTFPKIMSEKLVVTAFVETLTQTGALSSWAPPASLASRLSDKVTITSVFHKWMK